MSTVDPHRVMMTGENPFIRLSETEGGPETTQASFWRVIWSPAGPGHVLYLKSELTDDEWRIYSDNIAMARWLQNTIQGVLNEALGDVTIPVIDAEFEQSGDPNYYWTEQILTADEDIVMTWYDLGDPLLVHTEPDPDGRPYGVCTILMPAASARLTLNGVQAVGQPRPNDREGRPFSTCALAFSESWTQAR
jgi:hypothetical protein